ncbi:dockerin type I domain-containing protein [Lacipirellula sp.]|uniref:dockerin type I domain-containing protein n=1 Tax=Lacipirellula sp. TaxID=2691419 RepID=UPI003D0E93DA
MRSLQRTLLSLAAATGLCVSGQWAVAQDILVTFNVAGPADWNTGGNWSSGFTPEAQYNEVALIGALRQAYVAGAAPAVGGIIMDSSTLEIRSGGNLQAVANTSGSNTVLGNIVVGQSVNTFLTVKRGGSLTAQQLTTGGGTGTALTLGETTGAGTASLSIAGGTLNRITRVVGNSVNFTSSGGLTFGSASVLNPVITGAAQSTINVTGTANLAGVVRPEFSGYTPVLGNSWNLVTANQLAGNFTVDASLAPAGPLGTAYVVSKTNTTATLKYTNLLVLNVDRATGAVNIQNKVGSPIALDAYTITSPSGALTGSWNSLQDQGVTAWDEADNSSNSRRTEFRTNGSSSINAGGQLAIGNPFMPTAPAALGIEPGADLGFQYNVPGQGTFNGIIEYTGRLNNVVLTIDPATGKAAIQNESPYFSAAIDGYTVTSTSGKLLTANGTWNSLQDQGVASWDQADNANANRLTEFKTSGTTTLNGGGTVLNLGTPVSLASGALSLSDFGFQYKLSNGEVKNGIVKFGTIPTFNPGAGDYNNDGKVDGADFLAWQRGFGSSVTPGSGADGSGNGVVDAADLTIWKNGFGSATATGEAAAAAVPEPTTLSTVLLALGCLGGRFSRRAATGVRG